MRRFVKYIFLIINILSAAALLGTYVSMRIPPDKFWLPSVLGLAYPYILALNIFFVIFWLYFKKRLSLISLGVIIAGWQVLSGFIQLSGRTTDKSDIKVVSYNVKHFTGKGNNPSRELAEYVKGFLKESEPDIICLQEVKLRTNSVFDLEGTKKEFENIKHYQYARVGGTAGSVTLSRYPIVRMQEIRFEKSGNIAICTDMVAGKDTFRVFNVHLQSYRIDPGRYRIIESPGFTDENDVKEAKELGSKFVRAVKKRALQARIIRDKIKESPYPVIVCGDFNDTPASYAYNTVRGSLDDAFVGSGKGTGQTYVGKLPSFRIDYILHSTDFKSFNFRIYNIPYSDHLPISCDLIRKNKI